MITRPGQDPWVLGCLVAGVVLAAVTAIRPLPHLLWLGWTQLLLVSLAAARAAHRRPPRGRNEP